MSLLRLALLDYNEMKWIGVDFDGTLALHNTGDGVESCGAPIPAMVAIIKEHLASGDKVKVFTARVGDEDQDKNDQQKAMIVAWTKEHLGEELEVTCEKDGYMTVLYDDKAVQVVKNTGELVQ